LVGEIAVINQFGFGIEESQGEDLASCTDGELHAGGVNDMGEATTGLMQESQCALIP
jgi:hypothetical protein